MSMDAAAILKRLDVLGVRLAAEGEKLIARPKGIVPPEMAGAIREHRQDLVEYLRHPGYKTDFAGAGPGKYEILEVLRRVREIGFVLCWSPVLGARVAFHRHDVDPAALPPGFVPYSEHELDTLFALEAESGPLSTNALRLIHKAKTSGAKVIGAEGNMEVQE